MYAHRRTRLGAGLAVLLAAGLATTLGAAPAAHAAPAGTAGAGRPAVQPDRDSWRLTYSVAGFTPGVPGQYCQGAAVVGRKDAWVMAVGNSGSDKHHLSALHWNGHSWRPRLGGSLSKHPAEAIGASSASNAWLFGWDKHHVALHWNGKAWSKRKLPVWATQRLPHHEGSVLLDAVLSSRDAWLFDAVGDNGAHWNGHRWVKVAMPAQPGLISAVSSGDIWTIGVKKQHGATPYVPMHWNGKTWRAITSPGRTTSGHVGDFIALGAKDLWAIHYGKRYSLLHWNGRKWRSAGVPSREEPLCLARDGHGGLWLTGITTHGAAALYHRGGGGHWSRSSLPTPAGDKVSDLNAGLYWARGTRSVFALGDYKASKGTTKSSGIWQYGS